MLVRRMRVRTMAQGLAGLRACLPSGRCRAAQSALCLPLLSHCPALASLLRQGAGASARPREQQLLAALPPVRLPVPLPVLLPPLGMSRRGARLASHLQKVRRWPIHLESTASRQRDGALCMLHASQCAPHSP